MNVSRIAEALLLSLLAASPALADEPSGTTQCHALPGTRTIICGDAGSFRDLATGHYLKLLPAPVEPPCSAAVFVLSPVHLAIWQDWNLGEGYDREASPDLARGLAQLEARHWNTALPWLDRAARQGGGDSWAATAADILAGDIRQCPQALPPTPVDAVKKRSPAL